MVRAWTLIRWQNLFYDSRCMNDAEGPEPGEVESNYKGNVEKSMSQKKDRGCWGCCYLGKDVI